MELSLAPQTVKNLPAAQENSVQSLDWEDPLEKGMENPLQYSCLGSSLDRGTWWVTVMGSQRIGYD